jgi:uncharacterized membrane protein HdeD (DUF308 family)
MATGFRHLPSIADEIAKLRRSWVWLLVWGILLVMIGTVALAYPFMATVSSVMTFGVLLLLAAGVQFSTAFVARGWGGVLMALLVGAFYAFAGVILVGRPGLGAAGFTLFLAMLFFAVGVARIATGLVYQFSGWGWTVINGVVSIFLALLIWQDFPEAALWVIGVFVGIDLILAGWSWIMLATRLQRLQNGVASHSL